MSSIETGLRLKHLLVADSFGDYTQDDYIDANHIDF